MKTLYRILLAACIGLGFVVMTLQWAQAKDGDNAPMTPSDVCVFHQQLIISAEDAANGTNSGDVWETVITRCDQTAPTDPFYVDQSANMVERNAQNYCARTGPQHKSNCLEVSRGRNMEIAQRTHDHIEQQRQRVRGGH